MINKNLLKSKVVLAGLTFKKLAKKIDMSYQVLNNKKAGRSSFNPKEIKALKEVLNLTNDDVAEIFLI